MTTTYGSDAAVREQAKTTAKRKARKYTVIGAGLAVVLSAGGAYAAMTMLGNGSVTAKAYQAKDLTVTDAKPATDLYPGVESDLVMTVKNDNPFPVKITSLKATGAPTNVSAGCDLSKVTGPNGSLATQYNIPTADQPTVNGGSTQPVTIPKVLKMDISATQGCGFTIAIQVTAVQSAGHN
jgi:hypothetical protein